MKIWYISNPVFHTASKRNLSFPNITHFPHLGSGSEKRTELKQNKEIAVSAAQITKWFFSKHPVDISSLTFIFFTFFQPKFLHFAILGVSLKFSKSPQSKFT